MPQPILMHACCAPCSTIPLLRLADRYKLTFLFYGPNIHPKQEYLKRLDHMRRLCRLEKVPLIEAAYEPQEWVEAVSPCRGQPESSHQSRCQNCYRLRMGFAAQLAKQLDIGHFGVTLSISRHKNSKVIAEIGQQIATEHALAFLSEDFGKRDGYRLSVKRSLELGLYRQDYCGCEWSLEEARQRKKSSNRGANAMEDLQTLRNRLVGLVESFELDDPSTGVMAWVPVVGGTFVHPLTRAKIERFLIYGASQNQVKILEPKFLRSLPLIDISGLRHPSQLCAVAARTLGEILGRLGKIRQDVAAIGINLDLEHDLLRLRGVLDIDGANVQIAASDAGQLMIMAIDGRNCGSLERNQRTILLTDQPARDLANLKKLMQVIRIGWQHPPESQPSDQTAAVPIPQVPKVELGSGWGEFDPTEAETSRIDHESGRGCRCSGYQPTGREATRDADQPRIPSG